MKRTDMRIAQRLGALAVALTLVTPASAQKHYKDISFPALRDFRIPEAERVELANGMVLFLIEDHRLPLVSMSARIGVGSVYEPSDKVGLASMTGSVMREGGTATVPADELNTRLENIAATISTNIGATSGSAFMSALTENTDEVLELFADVLMNPAFPEDKIDLEKTQEKSSIARRNDDPQGIAFREFSELLYGSDSPYARSTEYATIEAITRDDLADFHARFFHPNNVIMGVWGDFDTQQMVEKIRSAFADWKRNDNFSRPPLPPVAQDAESGVFFVPKNDVTQSTVLLGHVGEVRRDHSDYPALTVMNEVLSGSFSSRLVQNVRDDQGLAYAVFGGYSANFDRPGDFFAGVMTKSETTTEAAKSVLHEVNKMREAPPTEAEMKLAMDSFLNSFVFNFDTRSEIVSRMTTYEYYGYPKDFLQTEKSAIQSVNAEDVHRVAKTYLKPEILKFIAVGRAEDFGAPLSDLGPVQEIDITIPSPDDDAIPEATEETLSQGRQMLTEAMDALGGADTFRNIKSIRQKSTQSITTPDNMQVSISLEATQVYPDKAYLVQRMPMGEVTVKMSAGSMKLITPQGEMDAPPQAVAQLTAQIWRDLPYLFAHSDKVEVQYLGRDEFEGKPAEALRITPPAGEAYTLYVSPESKTPTGMSYQGQTMMGAPILTKDVYADFRQAGPVMLPFSVTMIQEGGGGTSAIESIEINVDVDPSIFQ